ncbi:MAG: hypothetical protein JWO05_1137 [Gemmatimonadetes bacterium]|nr:hypothetical protein [Gemmatimonadota bacterium]
MINYVVVAMPSAVASVQAVPLEGGWGPGVPVMQDATTLDPLGRSQWGLWDCTLDPTTLAQLRALTGVTVTP